jgi:hypothetical protein
MATEMGELKCTLEEQDMNTELAPMAASHNEGNEPSGYEITWDPFPRQITIICSAKALYHESYLVCPVQLTTHIIHTCILASHCVTISNLITIILFILLTHITYSITYIYVTFFNFLVTFRPPSYELALPYLITNYPRVINPQMFSLFILFHFVKTIHVYIF